MYTHEHLELEIVLLTRLKINTKIFLKNSQHKKNFFFFS